MIKSLTIQNLQSWKDVTIHLHKGVNAFVGATDVGKSGIVRALRWLFFNQPIGESFRSTWGGDTIVSVDFSDFIVDRIRSDTDNHYALTVDEESVIYKVPGRGLVPEDIQDLLQVGNLNLQRQHDPHFLLSSTAGEVARFINSITDLDSIDISLRYINSFNTKCRSKLTDIEEALPIHKKKVDDLHWLDEADKDITEIEQLTTKAKSYKDIIEQTESIVESIDDLHDELFESRELIKAESDVDELIALYKQYNVYKEQIDSYRSAITNYVDNNDLIKQLKERKKYLQKEFDDLMPDICPLCEQEVLQ